MRVHYKGHVQLYMCTFVQSQSVFTYIIHKLFIQFYIEFFKNGRILYITSHLFTSTHGIRPEKLALVYPYVTLAISLRPNWRASNNLCNTYIVHLTYMICTCTCTPYIIHIHHIHSIHHPSKQVVILLGKMVVLNKDINNAT